MDRGQKTETIWETVFHAPRRSFNRTMAAFQEEECVDTYRRFVAPFSPRSGPFERLHRAGHAINIQAVVSCGFDSEVLSILRRLHERGGRA